MNISDIPIHTITQQYLDYIKKMRELNLEVAGEFVSMAATLIHIKSKMLLPQYDENGLEVIEAEDPRKELVQRLLEYERFQQASKDLNQRPLLGRDVWARGFRESIDTDDEEIITEDNALFSLIKAFRHVMKQINKNVHQVRAKGQSIAARILEIKDRLIPGQRITLNDLISPLERTSNKVLITFLSLLELTKMGFTQLFQAENYGDIHIDTKKSVDRNVIERVEEYDQKPEDRERLAQALMDESIQNVPATSEPSVVALTDGEVEALDQQMTFEIPVNTGVVNDTQEAVAQVHIREESASDEEIAAAENELFGETEVIDMDKIDQILKNFSLEQSNPGIEILDETPAPAAQAVETVDSANEIKNELSQPEKQVDSEQASIDQLILNEIQSLDFTETPVPPPIEFQNPVANVTDEEFEKAWGNLDIGSLETNPMPEVSLSPSLPADVVMLDETSVVSAEEHTEWNLEAHEAMAEIEYDAEDEFVIQDSAIKDDDKDNDLV